MAVNGQFQALAIIPWGKATMCSQCRGLDGPQWRLEIMGKSQIYCSFQNLNPDLSARGINILLLFIIYCYYWLWLNGLMLKY